MTTLMTQAGASDVTTCCDVINAYTEHQVMKVHTCLQFIYRVPQKR